MGLVYNVNMEEKMTYIITISSDGKTKISQDEMKLAIENGYDISFDLKDITPKSIQECRNQIKKIKAAGNILSGGSLDVNMGFNLNVPGGFANNKQVDLLIELDKDTKISFYKPINIYIDSDEYKTWTLEQIIDSNRRINEVTNKISNYRTNAGGQPLSPYEKYLCAYNWVSSFIYSKLSKEEDEKDPYISRDPIKVLSGDKIVCLGYAKLLQKICNDIGIPCYTQLCNEKTHANNLVCIIDPKYNINGVYCADCTLDSKRPAKEVSTYAYHALPYKKIIDNLITNISSPYTQFIYDYFLNKNDWDNEKSTENKKSIELELQLYRFYSFNELPYSSYSMEGKGAAFWESFHNIMQNPTIQQFKKITDSAEISEATTQAALSISNTLILPGQINTIANQRKALEQTRRILSSEFKQMPDCGLQPACC